MPMPRKSDPVLSVKCNLSQAVRWFAFDHYPMPEPVERLYDRNSNLDLDEMNKVQLAACVKPQKGRKKEPMPTLGELQYREEKAEIALKKEIMDGKIPLYGDYQFIRCTNKTEPSTGKYKWQDVEVRKLNRRIKVDELEGRRFEPIRYDGTVCDLFAKGKAGDWTYTNFDYLYILTEDLLACAPPENLEDVPPYENTGQSNNALILGLSLKEAFEAFKGDCQDNLPSFKDDRLENLFLNALCSAQLPFSYRTTEGNSIKQYSGGPLKIDTIDISKNKIKNFENITCKIQDINTFTQAVISQSNTVFANSAGYSNGFLDLMQRAIVELEITNKNQPKIEVVRDWLKKNRPLEDEYSDNLMNVAATLLRLPAMKQGKAARKP